VPSLSILKRLTIYRSPVAISLATSFIARPAASNALV
jgi:hypothetical protein